MAQLLSEAEIQAHLAQLDSWVVEGKQLRTTRRFKDFIAAVDFINRLVEPAETAGHHPDLEVSYNKVIISLTTHDAGGLTKNDFALAHVISQLN